MLDFGCSEMLRPNPHDRPAQPFHFVYLTTRNSAESTDRRTGAVARARTSIGASTVKRRTRVVASSRCKSVFGNTFRDPL